MRGGARIHGKAWSVRTHLLVFGAILVLPLAALSGFLLYQVADRHREQLEQRSLQIAAGVAVDLDRELHRRITILETLATSPLLANGDLAGFHGQATAALDGDRTGISLVDRLLQQRLNTYVSFGTDLPSYGSPDTALRVFELKKPQVSNFFIGRVTRRPAFDIAIPILGNDEVAHVLAMGLEPFILAKLLQGLNLPHEWTVGITDRNGIVLARSRDQDEFVGRPLLTGLSLQQPGIVSRTLTLEDEPVLRATARSTISGWQVAVNFPEAASEAPLRANLQLLGAWSILALVLTVGAAVWFARTVALPMQAAAKAAIQLGQDVSIVPFRSHVTEANELVAALERASADLARAHNQQRLLLQELNHRVKNLFGVVIAMTQRTLSSDQVRDQRELLVQRLHSLARAQELLLSSRWQGAPLEKIVGAELSPYPGRVEVRGDHVVLDPAATQALTMVLHELATNAMKYGALSTSTGRIHIAWQISEGPGSQLRLRWQESGGPTVQPPTHKGFGLTLLERALPEARIRSLYDPAGLVFELEVATATVVAEAADPSNNAQASTSS